MFVYDTKLFLKYLCFNIFIIEHLMHFSGTFITWNVLYINLFKIPTLTEASIRRPLFIERANI